MRGTTALRTKVVAVTFCRNEELTIQKCVESVLNQTVKPVCYVVVDDGSTDKTNEILKQFGANIELIQIAGYSRDRVVDHTAELFMLTVQKATEKVPNWRYLLKVDADHELFRKQYVANLICEMEQNPQLGITSGLPFTKTKQGYVDLYKDMNAVDVVTLNRSAWDGAKLYRRECFIQVQPLASCWGWDTAAETQARLNGWKVKSFHNFKFLDKRPSSDKKYVLKDWLQLGRNRSKLGFPFLNHLLVSLVTLKRRPWIIGALAFFLTYVINRLVGERPFTQEYYRLFRTFILEGNRRRMKQRRIQRFFVRCVKG